ncbi:MarR family transcriptional regulator [Dyella sp. M7H15-1]|nr:MarR family transcriptional regulator [Dyella sp. M7H15-1]
MSSHLGYWMRFVSNHVSNSFSRKLESEGVTVAEWVLMRELYDAHSMSPSHLADRLGMTRGAITRLADRLIGKSLVTRNAHPEDGRAQILALTRHGRKLVPKFASIADANDIEFFGKLPPNDRESLMRILIKIVDQHELKIVPID